MSEFMIAQINIHLEDEYARYGEGFMEIFGKYKGALLAVDDAAETVEGDWAYTRTVLLQFPTKADADEWYHSEEYQALAQHRFAASTANIVMVKGFDAVS